MRLIWSESAINGLVHVRSYIAENDPEAAEEVASILLRVAERLLDFPASGRAGRVPDTRELVILGLPFILPYRVRDDVVVILAVMHTSRNWPETLE
jgi:plasmid stabilization system protein ParE